MELLAVILDLETQRRSRRMKAKRVEQLKEIVDDYFEDNSADWLVGIFRSILTREATSIRCSFDLHENDFVDEIAQLLNWDREVFEDYSVINFRELGMALDFPLFAHSLGYRNRVRVRKLVSTP